MSPRHQATLYLLALKCANDPAIQLLFKEDDSHTEDEKYFIQTYNHLRYGVLDAEAARYERKPIQGAING